MVVGYSGESSGEDCGVDADSDLSVTEGAGPRCGYAEWSSASRCTLRCVSEGIEASVGVGNVLGDAVGVDDLSSAGVLEDQSQPIVMVDRGVDGCRLSGIRRDGHGESMSNVGIGRAKTAMSGCRWWTRETSSGPENRGGVTGARSWPRRGPVAHPGNLPATSCTTLIHPITTRYEAQHRCLHVADSHYSSHNIPIAPYVFTKSHDLTTAIPWIESVYPTSRGLP
jgi:hypothetical protein